MADGVKVPTDVAGPTIATDEVTRNAASEHQQLVKLSLGAEGAFDTIVDSGQQTMANSIPVVLPSDQTAVPFNLTPVTSGGLSLFRSIDLDETEEEVKGTAGQLYGWYLYNATASTLYVKVYNATAASVTVGTTTPVLTIPVPPYGAANVLGATGVVFATAITFAATTGVADSDTGAPAANALIANVFYK